MGQAAARGVLKAGIKKSRKSEKNLYQKLKMRRPKNKQASTWRTKSVV